MRRRDVLTGLAAAVAVGTAGCAGGTGGGGADANADADEPTGTATPTDAGTAPTVADSTLRAVDDCPDEATVAFDEGASAVAVGGCVTGRNGCAEPSMAGATYDADADRLRVVVTTVDDADEGTVCTQALTPRGYEATVTFDGGLPGSVVVVHDDAEGRREVAAATR
jgi:hypothetical protein